MNGIGWVVKQMQDGARVRRSGWNGKGMFLFLVEETKTNALGKKTLAFVMMSTAQGDYVPWLCSQTDLLAVDWELADA